MIEYEDFAEPHLQPLSRLAVTEGWDSFRDPETVRRALTAPGCIVMVAVDDATPVGFIQVQSDGGVRRALTAPGCIVMVAVDDATPVGFIQVQSDGGIHAHISNILVLESYRGQGVGRRLVEIAFDKSGANYIDLVSTEGSDDFYRSFVHEQFPGFRLYPKKTDD